jgi:hypothetical protein
MPDSCGCAVLATAAVMRVLAVDALRVLDGVVLRVLADDVLRVLAVIVLRVLCSCSYNCCCCDASAHAHEHAVMLMVNHVAPVVVVVTGLSCVFLFYAPGLIILNNPCL